MTRIDALTDLAIELQSIAQTGLYFGGTEYDRERYARVREIAVELMAISTDAPASKIEELFCSDEGYQTPKVDTRAAIIRDDKILLVRETAGTWSMPGGFCDVTLSPVDNTVKEAKEESGHDIAVKSVIAVQNRDYHNTPKFAFGMVKILYLCEDLGGAFIANSETTEARWFSEDELPEMDAGKSTEEQVRLCFAAARDDNWTVQFD